MNFPLSSFSTSDLLDELSSRHSCFVALGSDPPVRTSPAVSSCSVFFIHGSPFTALGLTTTAVASIQSDILDRSSASNEYPNFNPPNRSS